MLVDGVDLAAAMTSWNWLKSTPRQASPCRSGATRCQPEPRALTISVFSSRPRPPVCLLVADPRAIGALKDRVQLTITTELGRVAYGIEYPWAWRSEVGVVARAVVGAMSAAMGFDVAEVRATDGQKVRG